MLAMLAITILSGCSGSNSTSLIVPSSRGRPPAASSPLGVAAAVQWCWENRDTSYYRQLLAADFTFQFAPGDSSGVRSLYNPWLRNDELIFASNLFVNGSEAEAPASTINLSFPSARLLRDLRPGKTYPWHQVVSTNATFFAQKTDGTGLAITGEIALFVVRGDSAQVPAELGLARDSTRWFLEQWTDSSTVGVGNPGLLRAFGSLNFTWGRLRVLYR